jgi:Imm-5 like putative immunity protein
VRHRRIGVGRMLVIGVPAMILPEVRDPRFETIRRGGILTDSDHQLLALWAASCAEHVLDLFESPQPEDPRPRQAIELARAWVRGEVTLTQARTAAGHALDAAESCGGSTARRVRCWPGRGRPATGPSRYEPSNSAGADARPTEPIRLATSSRRSACHSSRPVTSLFTTRGAVALAAGGRKRPSSPAHA